MSWQEKDLDEFVLCIKDLIAHPMVQSMDNYLQHSQISCLNHSLTVAYYCYRWSVAWGLDYRSAVRGALLHDFFLYDWHVTKLTKGLHGFEHPKIALANAELHFTLNQIEKDIIVKHMWPLTLAFPLYRESWLVTMMDKYCSLLEIINPNHEPLILNQIIEQ
jgi:uncharacterized protein